MQAATLEADRKAERLREPRALPAFSEAAKRLKASQAEGLERTSDVIVRHLSSSVPLIPEVARHLIGAGGKRLRPLLTLAAAEACGYTSEGEGEGGGEGDTQLAAAVELIHAATLLHDDVVDESALRRGLATANVVFGNKESVLVGDFLFARAFELMVAAGSMRVLGILSAASCTISEGEVLQLETQGNLATSEATYEAVVRAKTAALFSAATQAGAALSEAPGRIEAALAEYGDRFGVAYQVVDDALDYAGDEDAIGKRRGDDFREAKLTLPVILAYRAARDADERAFWERTIGERDQRPGDFERARGLIARDGMVERSLDVARGHAGAAAEALEALPPSALRQTLADLALSSVVRRA